MNIRICMVIDIMGKIPKYSYYGGLGQPISNGIDMMIHNNYYGPVNV